MTRGSTAVSRAFTAPTLRYHWDDDAACLTADPELFCADRNDPDVAEKYRTALAGYCHRCTVRPECLTRQLAAEPPTGTSHRYGIAGGLTPSQRAEPALCALVLAGKVPPLPRLAPRREPAARPAPKPCGSCGKPVPPAGGRTPDRTWWCSTPECRAAAKEAADERKRKAARQEREAWAAAARIAEWVGRQPAA